MTTPSGMRPLLRSALSTASSIPPGLNRTVARTSSGSGEGVLGRHVQVMFNGDAFKDERNQVVVTSGVQRRHVFTHFSSNSVSDTVFGITEVTNGRH